MIFKVSSSGYKFKNVVLLTENNWDDWFTYETTYSISYYDENNTKYDIGQVKIGQFPYPEHSKKPTLPLEFSILSEEFFSLGQSEYYYERIDEINKTIYNGFREELLIGLRDIAFNENLFNQVRNYDVTRDSLLRSISSTTVRGQFNRIANGGARLTPYDFKFVTSDKNGFTSMELDFNVEPESKIPTNIHVLIGRNGVGKTHLMQNMISSLMQVSEDNEFGEFKFDEWANETTFSNVIYVSFSAFDNIKEWYFPDKFNSNIPFTPIGLDATLEDLNTNLSDKFNEKINSHTTLDERFANSIEFFSGGYKVDLWKKAITLLESDPLFKERDILSIFNNVGKVDKVKAKKLFHRLSSGHKIIMLTITKLVEKVEEKTLVFIDEPEGHLHPPLLSSFIRALSDLLNNRNGVAIIATHSPVVLQEVPRKCVWKLRRSGRYAFSERLDIESFGQSIGSLTREVFGLEVTNSGFHNILKKVCSEKDSFNEVLHYFNNELGLEAMAMIQAMITDNK